MPIEIIKLLEKVQGVIKKLGKFIPIFVHS